MSLIDSLAEGKVDLDNLRICDLGIDITAMGWTENADGIFSEVVAENDLHDMNQEEVEWVDRVLDSCRRTHTKALVRLYVLKEGSTEWEYNGLYGAGVIVTEADLRMACAHFIRLVDLGGFNPNSSLILQQEIYENFEYKKLTPWFHYFEMDNYIAGFSFAKEECADTFYEKIQYCLKTSARDVIDEEIEGKEKTFILVGDNGFRSASENVSISLAKKYAAGGITDGTEVSWAKKKKLPPELAKALGIVQDEEESEQNMGRDRVKDSKKIDLLANPEIQRRSTVSSLSSDSLKDGVTMQWSKNKTALTGTKESPELGSPTPPRKNANKRQSSVAILKKFGIGSKK